MSHFQSIVQLRKEIGVVCGGHMQFRSLVTNVLAGNPPALLQRSVCAPEYELEKMGRILKIQTVFYENPTQTHFILQGVNAVFHRYKMPIVYSGDVLSLLEAFQTC